jgi:hypothetical protein
MDRGGPVKIAEKSAPLDQTTWPVRPSGVMVAEEVRLVAKDRTSGIGPFRARSFEFTQACVMN